MSTLSLPGGSILALDPVPWARAQMAFTLACHIILVPLGVSWACMTLVANWRAIKRGDEDALLLAQRWSKYMAVTFAVGAVTGTVLTFEFGLLWPRFMGTWGAAFGIPFSIEGLFFFIEAIFIALYIFGWKRLRPWPHFWTGVPIVLAGIGGTLSVVAANAWMNEPAGFTLNKAGEVVDVDPLEVIFNDAWPYEASHMLVAAYLVGGFLVASVYAVGMLKGRRDRYHRLGFLIPFTVAAIATPIQMLVGDTLARWVYNNEPTKFAAIELVPETDSDVPETLLGRLDSDGDVTGGIAIPGLASWLSDPSTGTSTVVQGLDSFPADERPTTGRGQHRPSGVGRDGRHRHAAVPAVGVVLARLDLPARHAEVEAVPLGGLGGRCRRGPGDGGRVGGHRGRAPALDRPQPHEGRGCGHDQRRRLDHVHRRRGDLPRPGDDRGPRAPEHEPAVPPAGRLVDSDVPYGPRELRSEPRRKRSASVDDAVAVVLFVAVSAYALFAGADFGAGFWDLVAGGAAPGARPRPSSTTPSARCGKPTTCG